MALLLLIALDATAPQEPPFIIPPVPRTPQDRWQLVLNTAGDQIELVAAKDRHLVARLVSPSEMSFTLNGKHESALSVEELVSDVIAYRNGAAVYRGRVGATSDEIGEAHSVPISTGDYRSLLKRRNLYDDDQLVWTDTDQSQIAFELIEQTQARTGGDLGITQGLLPVPDVERDRTYEAGKPIGEAIQQLSEVVDGFDWDIDPSLRLNIWHPERGDDHSVVLDWGGLLSKVSRAVDPSRYANAVRVNGDDTLTPEEREAADLADRDEGRWDAQHGYTTITQQGTLSDRADWQIAQDQVLIPTYTVQMTAGRWEGPGHVWLGDPVRLVVGSGRLDVNTILRVFEVDIKIGEDGDETVVLALGGPRPDFRTVIGGQRARLADLERR